MKTSDRIYIENMMKDVKETANGIQPYLIPGQLEDKIALNFYRIADAITKIVQDGK